MRPGFYFSLASSAIFDVSGNKVLNSSLIPGQVRVTQAEYEAINLAQLEELWSTYGADAEVWFSFLLGSLCAVVTPCLAHTYTRPHPHSLTYALATTHMCLVYV